ncbi:MAG: nitroreductase family protein [Desulfobacterota bacterium]|nr:nitroreductase family protein [Thermodesulfobacteriota bacterium]MDW8002255.1 nitroreductase family protein [Deltaproteobacteria bacterium]
MIEILRERRSIRKYKDIPIEAEKIELLKEAVLRSPSSRGINPWVFIFVDDKDLLLKLSYAKEHGSSFLKDAVLGVVVMGDETRSDCWVEDCSIASIILQLVAQSLGLGSCWIQIRNRMHSKEKTAEDYVRELLSIPSNLRVLSIISIGYPAERKRKVKLEELEHEKIYRNRFGER